VHLIAIPLRHFFWPPVTRGKPNQQHVAPKSRGLSLQWRKFGKLESIFTNIEDNREDWHKAEKRTGLTLELPLIDSAAKWSSFFSCLSVSSSPRSWSPDTWKFALIRAICHLMKNGGG